MGRGGAGGGVCVWCDRWAGEGRGARGVVVCGVLGGGACWVAGYHMPHESGQQSLHVWRKRTPSHRWRSLVEHRFQLRNLRCLCRLRSHQLSGIRLQRIGGSSRRSFRRRRLSGSSSSGGIRGFGWGGLSSRFGRGGLTLGGGCLRGRFGGGRLCGRFGGGRLRGRFGGGRLRGRLSRGLCGGRLRGGFGRGGSGRLGGGRLRLSGGRGGRLGWWCLRLGGGRSDGFRGGRFVSHLALARKGRHTKMWSFGRSRDGFWPRFSRLEDPFQDP